MQYDDGDGPNNLPVPPVRERMEAEDSDTPKAVSQLPPGEMGCPAVERTEKGPAKEGYIYFIETEDGQYVKIGYSRNVIARMSQLRTLRPASFRLKLLGSIPGNPAIERWLHQLFARDRDNGEWFKTSDRLRAMIALIELIPPILRTNAARGRKKKRKLDVESILSTSTPKDELAAEMAKKRWKGKTKQERSEHMRMMIQTRWKKTKKKRKTGNAK